MSQSQRTSSRIFAWCCRRRETTAPTPGGARRSSPRRMAGKLSYGKSAQNKTQADPPLVGYAGELIAAAAGAAPSEPAPPSGMKRGRPPADPNAEPHFFCDEPGCALAYITYGGLYQHRRKHHPWLIAEAKQVAVANGKRPRGRPRDSERNMDQLKHECPVCEKSYASYGGLYQHKRAHHPELVTARDSTVCPPC